MIETIADGSLVRKHGVTDLVRAAAAFSVDQLRVTIDNHEMCAKHSCLHFSRFVRSFAIARKQLTPRGRSRPPLGANPETWGFSTLTDYAVPVASTSNYTLFKNTVMNGNNT